MFGWLGRGKDKDKDKDSADQPARSDASAPPDAEKDHVGGRPSDPVPAPPPADQEPPTDPPQAEQTADARREQAQPAADALKPDAEKQTTTPRDAELDAPKPSAQAHHTSATATDEPAPDNPNPTSHPQADEAPAPDTPADTKSDPPATSAKPDHEEAEEDEEVDWAAQDDDEDLTPFVPNQEEPHPAARSRPIFTNSAGTRGGPAHQKPGAEAMPASRGNVWDARRVEHAKKANAARATSAPVATPNSNRRVINTANPTNPTQHHHYPGPRSPTFGSPPMHHHIPPARSPRARNIATSPPTQSPPGSDDTHIGHQDIRQGIKRVVRGKGAAKYKQPGVEIQVSPPSSPPNDSMMPQQAKAANPPVAGTVAEVVAKDAPAPVGPEKVLVSDKVFEIELTGQAPVPLEKKLESAGVRVRSYRQVGTNFALVIVMTSADARRLISVRFHDLVVLKINDASTRTKQIYFEEIKDMDIPQTTDEVAKKIVWGVLGKQIEQSNKKDEVTNGSDGQPSGKTDTDAAKSTHELLRKPEIQGNESEGNPVVHSSGENAKQEQPRKRNHSGTRGGRNSNPADVGGPHGAPEDATNSISKPVSKADQADSWRNKNFSPSRHHGHKSGPRPNRGHGPRAKPVAGSGAGTGPGKGTGPGTGPGTAGTIATPLPTERAPGPFPERGAGLANIKDPSLTGLLSRRPGLPGQTDANLPSSEHGKTPAAPNSVAGHPRPVGARGGGRGRPQRRGGRGHRPGPKATSDPAEKVAATPNTEVKGREE